MASQNFTIFPAAEVFLQGSKQAAISKVANVSANKVHFSTTIGGKSEKIGKLDLVTYILKSSGTIGTSTESWDVRANDVKFNIVLSEWSWCGCKKGQTNQVGAFIDVDVEIKGRGGAPKQTGGNKTYDMGGTPLQLSNQILADGKWVSMPAGYPKLTLKGSKAIFTFRFPRFTTSATYDPIIGMSSTLPATNPDNSDNNLATSDSTMPGPSSTVAFACLMMVISTIRL